MIGESEITLAELLAEVRRIEVLSRRLVTDVMAGGYSSVFRGSGIEFNEVREYVEGDDPRSVDWNVTARLGRPYVKKYVDERELTVVFMLDLSASMGGGFGLWSARQTAARLCACLALSAVRNGDKVGFLAFGRGVERFVPPGKGLGHVLRIVRDCLALPETEGEGDLAPALEFAARAISRHAVVFCVSDYLSGGWDDALLRCSLRHDLVAVRLAPPELELPRGGLVRLRCAETGRAATVDLDDESLRRDYAERVAAWREATEASLRRARVDLMDVPVPRAQTKEAIAGPILRFFRMRELRGAKR